MRSAQVLSLTEFYLSRYERFPRLSKYRIKRLRRLREAFPHGVRFGKPFYVKAGFHNPDIEIRFKEPIPG